VKRRELLLGAAGLLTAPRALRAQQKAMPVIGHLNASSAPSSPEDPARVGFLSGGDEEGAAGFVAALRDGLAVEGYHEPDSLNLECLYADYSLERVPALVAEVERRRVELIVTHAAATSIVVKGYRTVPVVYEFTADPVATGIAADLAHPFFNATGVTLIKAEPQQQAP
jgi:ABC-type uncharacterized transport system substrate-binding protein